MSRILVTPRALTAEPGQKALDPLRRAGHQLVFAAAGTVPDEAQLLRLLPGCAGWLAGTERISATVIAAADALRVIVRNGTGVDNIDLGAAAAAGIDVVRVPGANANAVAELAVALLLAAERRLVPAAAALGAGQHRREAGRELRGRRIGILGLGAIGGRVAELLDAFGAEVIGHDPAPPARPVPARRVASVEALLEASEIVSLHCPPPPGGAALLDAGRLRRLPRGAGVVNTARAALVDEAAMAAALDAGGVGWYATDVSADAAHDAPILRHPRVLATPHLGGLTQEAARAVNEAAVARLLAALTPVGAPA